MPGAPVAPLDQHRRPRRCSLESGHRLDRNGRGEPHFLPAGRRLVGEHGGRQRGDLAAALRHLHAPVLARAVGLDQPHVEIEAAFRQ